MQANWILNQVLALSLFAAPVFAAPGDGVGDSQPHLEILALPAAGTTALCAPQGGLCMSAGAASTVLVPPPVASAAAGTVTAPPQFARQPALANMTDPPVPWIVDIGGALRHPALAGNALFLIYDAQDPEALPKHEVLTLWQAPIAAGNRIAARLSLNPDDGFRPAHNYLIQVAQLVNGKELVLAEGELRLQ